ncbi:beta strand repeat-containing protein [Deinococcus marmoris]|uniref:beta strand repeat-containing protein n=1 Tax=Deinococcus marmoris TaxID=249408 RepID=UPI00068C384D|nr:DUF11 domain-containing protein [Deinococcus marmoris]
MRLLEARILKKWLRPLQHGLVLGLLTGVSGTLAQGVLCGTPGKDGVGTGLTGVVNTYYPGSANASAGATTISIGTPTGASTAVATGDLLLVIQMQDAALNIRNDERYGDGTGTANNVTGNGSGITSIGAGKYEYVVAKSAVSGGNVTVAGLGTGGGLLNSYSASPYSDTNGQKTFQVIRVPQYSSVTLGGTLTASAWNGSTGGIVAIDVSGSLGMSGGVINVSGLGFRGGAGRSLAGAITASNTDYRNLSTLNAHAQKGEGVAGTPAFVNNAGSLLNTNVEGYPSGSSGQGAPGNAGGGGTDGNAAANDQNSGGGGGANSGAGGRGGNTWSTNRASGGYGGASVTASATRLVMGGGGGAGTTNNGTGTPGSGFASSGAVGGGLVLIRAGTVSGSGSITASGADANNTVDNDGSGGGGAGGSVLVLAQGALPSSLTINVNGGKGGTNTGGAVPHGPGGGGGGGVVALSGTGPTITATGGVNGATAGTPAAFGSTPGLSGQTLTITGSDVPGVRATALCVADLAISKSGPVAIGSTRAMSYILRVWNNGPNAVSGVGVDDVIPSGFTVTGITCVATGAAVCGTQSSTGTSITVGTGNLALDTAPSNTTPDGNFLTYTLTGTAPANGTLSNTASLTVPNGITDATTGNNTSAAIQTRIINAINDLAVSFSFGSGGTVSVLGNDTNGGAAATTTTSAVTVSSNGGITGLSVANGQLVVPPATVPGTYTVTYQLCDSAVGTACDTATVPITVFPAAPTLTVSKISNGGVGTFAFSGSNGFGSQNITTTTDGTARAGTKQTLSAASTATTITETPLAGYVLASATCSGMGSGGTATLSGNVLTLNAAATAAGSDITCTFVNNKPPSITLLKLGRNISVSPSQPFIGSAGSIGVKPGETVEYCIVYSNTGGVASNFSLTDYVPVGMVAQLPAYGTSGTGGTGDPLGLKYAVGVALAVNDVNSNTVTPTLTSKSGDDVGTLSTVPVTNPGDPTGSPQRPGVMTLTLPTVAANSKGTVCFQARVP